MMAIVYQHFAYENSIHHWGTYIISFFGGLNPQMRTNTGSSFKIWPSFLFSSFLVFQFPNSLGQLVLGKIETGPLPWDLMDKNARFLSFLKQNRDIVGQPQPCPVLPQLLDHLPHIRGTFPERSAETLGDP